MFSFKMLCYTFSILIIKYTQETFCFCGLIFIIFFINYNFLFTRINLTGDSLRFVSIDITKIISIIHQYIKCNNIF